MDSLGGRPETGAVPVFHWWQEWFRVMHLWIFFSFWLNNLPYLPVYNTRPYIIRTPIFDQIFHKKKFSQQKKNVNSSYNWCFAVVSFITISDFLLLVITVIRYDCNVYLLSCFLNTLISLFMDLNWKCFIGRLFNSSQ